jgi:heat-inducible transcriptional repressor
MISELNERSREILRQIVDGYVLTGEPVGSRTIARRLNAPLSPATIRNVMADLEEAGLLYAPHTSAGRVPTDAGLRLYVDGLLEVGNLSEEERRRIDGQCAGAGRGVQEVLGDATDALSNLSHFAGLVLAPKTDRPFKHIEFVPLSPGRALVVVVTDNGMVENRVLEVPVGMSAAALIEAGNYLTTRLAGRNFADARELIRLEIEERRSQLDRAAQEIVQAGLAVWANDNARERDEGVLIVRGQANLLNDITKLTDLERVRALFEALEAKKNLLRVLDLLQAAEGVQLYIGSENELFGLSGCSMVVAPYTAGEAGPGSKVIGAIGVIGPTRMNYARIIPMVDYTARVVSRLLGSPDVEMRT